MHRCPAKAARHNRNTSIALSHSNALENLSCHTGICIISPKEEKTALSSEGKINSLYTLLFVLMRKRFEHLLMSASHDRSSPQTDFQCKSGRSCSCTICSLYLCTGPPGGPDLFLSHSSQIWCPSAPVDLSDTLEDQRQRRRRRRKKDQVLDLLSCKNAILSKQIPANFLEIKL